MNSARLEIGNTMEDNTIKDTRNIFQLKRQNNQKKKIAYTAIKDEAIKERIISNLFEYEEEGCYKPVTVGSSGTSSYIKYESNGDRNKTLSIKEYLNSIRPRNDLKKFDTWKIQLTIAINFMSSEDNDEERAVHSKSDNIEIMFNDKSDEVIEEFFQLLSIMSRWTGNINERQ